MSDDRDELLFALLERLVALSRDGRMPDFAKVTHEHPELEVELRELWATAMIADDFGSFTQSYGGPPELELGDVEAPRTRANSATLRASAISNCSKRSVAAAWGSSTAQHNSA